MEQLLKSGLRLAEASSGLAKAGNGMFKHQALYYPQGYRDRFPYVSKSVTLATY